MVSGVEAKRLEVEQTTSNKTETTFTISNTYRYQLTGYIATERESSIGDLNSQPDMLHFGSTAAKTAINQPGSAIERTAEIRLERPLISEIGQEPSSKSLDQGVIIEVVEHK